MKNNERKSKEVTNKEEIEYLISLDGDKIGTTVISELFGDFGKGPKYNTYDIITIPKNSYGPEGKRNKNEFKTTVGLLIYNKIFFEKELHDEIGYINHTVNGKEYKNIDSKLVYALIEDRITTDQLKRYLIKTQKMMPYVAIYSYGYTEKMLTCTKVLNKKKKELIKKYEKEINDGDIIACSKIEKELLDYAREYLGDDPSLDMFMSGARGSWENNFKNMFVMKGAIKDPDPNAKKKYNIVTSNYMDGVSKDEYSILCNSLAAGPFARANNTSNGGYWEKLIIPAYSDVVLAKPGSDCGTSDYITVNLDKSNISLYMYSFIIEGSKLVELNSTNMDKYIGKRVKFRFSSMCEYKNCVCNACIGNLYYKTGKQNIGNNLSMIASTLKNISMKSFHDSQEKVTKMDICKAFNIK